MRIIAFLCDLTRRSDARPGLALCGSIRNSSVLHHAFIWFFRIGGLHCLVRMVFPSHFPKECPPAAASSAAGELFRFVWHKPPEPSDFVSVLLAPGKKRFAPDRLCQACGLSVLTNEEDAALAQKIVPLLRKMMLAKARVSAEWGAVAPTRGYKGHHTWWVADGKTPEKIFDVI